ncbi:MAG TPA: GyrI-like domain-containing protein [Gemmatimonadaceae bacterium]
MTSYHVSVQRSAPRTIAAVHARMPVQQVKFSCREYLDQVYAAGRAGAVKLDGQNIFLYQPVPDQPDQADVAFGVGTVQPFAGAGSVQPVDLPAGDVATTTHWGDYSGLGRAHHAVIEWCRANGHRLTGTHWEIYGHWTDDSTKLRTDVCHLLARV